MRFLRNVILAAGIMGLGLTFGTACGGKDKGAEEPAAATDPCGGDPCGAATDPCGGDPCGAATDPCGGDPCGAADPCGGDPCASE